ncbi:hypothetical protein KL918_002807 [Ogataea parapolymorpha]|uniref:DNA mismatch repair protein mutL n=1 Tax=Ogataea parapolymorpha (strain ATCC 26012 / BCRC 20466 / JCM 22074 / NRRL Y-7560 / DL-1) TaxID=871575 RepID=W1QHT7_OGAPD|nr:DNA mismatch repair protein mutL [Ogataea parapolymorpha DL-1]ESX01165.1 DNA mismatch repair protein mutL [Ogataea parapolymorpha DL-1]KAG7867368.1 hypothetical protein KL918_002807 [Ogataea parapolymorpha]KAG7871094.1 hypothetical protein KL916_004460 [Ogataea parapolymorpha]
MDHGKIRPVSDAIRSGIVVVDGTDVVRELLENSIDSGASYVTISVAFEHGCLDIEVVDNGSGIGPPDFAAMGRRHWTSKNLEESKFGFRGESLHAIMGLCTRTEIVSGREGCAWKMHYIGTTARENPRQCAFDGASGTLVHVFDVFGRLPVRKRQLAAEWREMTAKLSRTVFSVLVARPGVTVTLERNGVRVFSVTNQGGVAGIVGLLEELYGLRDAVEPIKASFEDVCVTGVLGPDVGKKCQFLFLNGRLLENRSLQRTISLQLGARSGLYVFDIRTPLEESDLLQSPSKKVFSPVLFDKIKAVLEEVARRWIDRDRAVRLQKKARPSLGLSRFFSPASDVVLDGPTIGRSHVVAQVESKFVLVRIDGVLVALDQHACDERVRVEALYRQWTASTHTVAVCIEITVDAGEIERFARFAAELSRWGIKYRQENGVVVVHEILALVADKDAVFLQTGVLQFLDDLASKRKRTCASSVDWWVATTQMPEMYHETIRSQACREAIRFGKTLDKDSQRRLVADLALCRDPLHCAHGRPTCVPLIRWLDK